MRNWRLREMNVFRSFDTCSVRSPFSAPQEKNLFVVCACSVLKVIGGSELFYCCCCCRWRCCLTSTFIDDTFSWFSHRLQFNRIRSSKAELLQGFSLFANRNIAWVTFLFELCESEMQAKWTMTTESGESNSSFLSNGNKSNSMRSESDRTENNLIDKSCGDNEFRFGWFKFYPKCLQTFLSAKWALFWMCWAGALQGKNHSHFLLF